MRRSFILLATTGIMMLMISGCGTVDTRSTVEQMTNARVAVESAEKMDAEKYASQDLRHAQDALAIARDAYANQAFERAFDFSKKATIYALVAKAKTEQKRAEEKLADVEAQLAKVTAQTDAYMKPSAPVAAAAPQPSGVTPVVQEGVQP